MSLNFKYGLMISKLQHNWHCYNIIACFHQITNIKDLFDEADRNWELRSFRILRSIEWYFLNDVSGQHIGPIFNGQVVQSLYILVINQLDAQNLF